jgi:hypothetical protein
MVDKNSLNRRVDDLLERLRYLEMVIRNLKERNGTLITNVGNIDERLFRELANYEMSTEELKKDFVLLLLQDAKRLGDACIKNINIFNKTSEEFNKIDEILDFIRSHETQDIEKSRELQKFAEKAKIRLDNIRKEMNEKVREKKKEKEEYERAQAMHRQLK